MLRDSCGLCDYTSRSDLIKMKTKAIITCLLVLFLCLRAGVAHACVCPAEKTVSATAVLSAADGDNCTECGHKKSCCKFNLESTTLAGGDAVAVLAAVALVQQQAFSFNTCRFKNSAQWCFFNKAPPNGCKPTLLAMHQQLLI